MLQHLIYIYIESIVSTADLYFDSSSLWILNVTSFKLWTPLMTLSLSLVSSSWSSSSQPLIWLIVLSWSGLLIVDWVRPFTWSSWAAARNDESWSWAMLTWPIRTQYYSVSTNQKLVSLTWPWYMKLRRDTRSQCFTPWRYIRGWTCWL